ncbi:MAG: hypothetical protein ACRCZE_02330 [Candidatus Altimarinota bacterium]
MSEQANNQAEQKNEKLPKTGADLSKETLPATPGIKSETVEDKAFADKLSEKSDQYEKKLEELKKKFDASGSVGKSKTEVLFAKQINKIRDIKARKQAEFQKLMIEEKSKRQEIMLGEADQSFNEVHQNLSDIIAYVGSFDQIDNRELAIIEAVLNGMSKLKTNPQAEALFQKTLKNQPLQNPQDYDLIIGLIQPGELNPQNNPGKLFESCQSGVVIAMMSPEEKLLLTQRIIQTKSPQEASSLIDAFVTYKILTIDQLNYLIAQNQLPEPLKTEFTQKMENGEIGKNVQTYEQIIERSAQQNAASTAKNPVWKAAGTPGLMALSALWGAATMLVNFSANFDYKDLSGSAKRILTNPYMGLGAAAFGVGAVGLAPMIAPKTYEQGREYLKGTFSKEHQQNRDLEARDELGGLTLDLLGKHPYLKKFLLEKDLQTKKTGLDLLIEQFEIAKASKKDLKINFQALRESAGENQKILLNRALGMANSNENYLSQELTNLTMTAFPIGLKNNEKFQKFIEESNRKQGISGSN